MIGLMVLLVVLSLVFIFILVNYGNGFEVVTVLYTFSVMLILV